MEACKKYYSNNATEKSKNDDFETENCYGLRNAILSTHLISYDGTKRVHNLKLKSSLRKYTEESLIIFIVPPPQKKNNYSNNI